MWSWEEICTAAGLEVSVARWWKRPKLKTWLRKTLRKGIAPGCAQLLRWGVPQHVLTSGGQLGQYLAEDPALYQQFQQLRQENAEVPAWFLTYMVSKVDDCFEIRYHTSLNQSGLILAPRRTAAPRPTPPRPSPTEFSEAPLEASEASEEEVLAPAAPAKVVPKKKLVVARRALTMTLMNRKKEVSLPPRPATVTGTSPGLVVVERPRLRRVPRMKSSFSLWNERKTMDVQEHKQMVQKKMSTKKLEAGAQRVRKALPLNMSKKHLKKIVQDLGELRRIFDYFDKDGSDSIEPVEFPSLLVRLLKQPAQGLDRKEMWEIWDEIDEDGSGHISFDEFQRWYCRAFRLEDNPDRTSFISSEQVPAHDGLVRSMAKKFNLDYIKVDSLWTRFSSFDVDKNGTLEYPEFTRLIQKELSPSGAAVVPDKVVQKFWIEVDSDKSGVISFSEFCGWYMKYLFGGKSPMEQYYANFSSRGSVVASKGSP